MENRILAELGELKKITLLSVKKALTTADVANLTGLSKAYIYKLVMKREIPFYKSEGGKITYFNADDVQKWMFAHRYATKAEAEQEAIKHLLNSKN